MSPDQYSSRSSSVRVATEDDAPAILRLLKTAQYKHVHVDWNMPVDWLGDPGFVVQQSAQSVSTNKPSLVTHLLRPQRGLEACLAVAADPPPAAWVRVACVSDGVARPAMAFESMLDHVIGFLRKSSVTELGWLAANVWPQEWLTQLGFVKANHIETYLKYDLELPELVEVRHLTFRPARQADMTILAEIEEAAFLPIWRHSAEGLSLAKYRASSFDVAILDGRIVGFQLSTSNNGVAHLVRLTVDPSVQGCGIGSALLARAIEGYRAKGLQQVSLNTQVDNLASQFLYRKFGFQATGQRLPLWSLSI